MTAFAPALLDPSRAVPADLIGPDGAAAGRRFNVYRNNVVTSLIAAMEDGFPVVRKLVGEAFFAAMAGVFVREHPPTSPVLNRYGADFPAFLAGFEPVAHLPYLADTARLELALRAAYNAADASRIDPAALSHPRLVEARLRLAPAVRIVASPYPIHAIWRANIDPTAPPASGGAETVLVSRPDWDPRADLLPEGAAPFITALLEGEPLAAALDRADPGLDLGAVLTLFVETKSITAIEVPA